MPNDAVVFFVFCLCSKLTPFDVFYTILISSLPFMVAHGVLGYLVSWQFYKATSGTNTNLNNFVAAMAVTFSAGLLSRFTGMFYSVHEISCCEKIFFLTTSLLFSYDRSCSPREHCCWNLRSLTRSLLGFSGLQQ